MKRYTYCTEVWVDDDYDMSEIFSNITNKLLNDDKIQAIENMLISEKKLFDIILCGEE